MLIPFFLFPIQTYNVYFQVNIFEITLHAKETYKAAIYHLLSLRICAGHETIARAGHLVAIAERQVDAGEWRSNQDRLIFIHHGRHRMGECKVAV